MQTLSLTVYYTSGKYVVVLKPLNLCQTIQYWIEQNWVNFGPLYHILHDYDDWCESLIACLMHILDMKY